MSTAVSGTYEYNIEFSAMCTGILEKVVHSPNRDVNDHYAAMSIWRKTYWKWFSAIQLLVSEG